MRVAYDLSDSMQTTGGAVAVGWSILARVTSVDMYPDTAPERSPCVVRQSPSVSHARIPLTPSCEMLHTHTHNHMSPTERQGTPSTTTTHVAVCDTRRRQSVRREEDTARACDTHGMQHETLAPHHTTLNYGASPSTETDSTHRLPLLKR